MEEEEEEMQIEQEDRSKTKERLIDVKETARGRREKAHSKFIRLISRMQKNKYSQKVANDLVGASF